MSTVRTAPQLRFERDGDIAFVIADNPARMNAFTAAMWEAVPACIAEAVRDPDVRVIVLRGAGERAFSAGADISEFETQRSGDKAAAYDALSDAAFTALTRCPKPIIAMEATMELTMRLNVLAAVLSFGFIAAIVFGMV